MWTNGQPESLEATRKHRNIMQEKKKKKEDQPTRFEAPVDISRTPGSDGANDGAEI